MIKDLINRIKSCNDECEKIVKDTRIYLKSLDALAELEKELQRAKKERELWVGVLGKISKLKPRRK